MIAEKTLNILGSMLTQAKYNSKNNTDEEAYYVKDLYEDWISIPVGTEIAQGTFLNYEDILYKTIQTHVKQEAWNPADAPSLFAKVLIPDPEVIPEWEQPSSTNPYMTGDKVKHNGHIWQSLIDNNVWEPSADVPTLWEDLGVE